MDPIIILSKFYPWIVKYSIEKGLDPDKPRYLTKVTKTFNKLNNIDIVIVGAGSAGCILANKLINNTNYNILLIEAGPKDSSPIVHVPWDME